MAFSDARAAVIEIVEQLHEPSTDSLSGSLICPTEVRINGQPLLCSADHPIKVHEITFPPTEAVMVTLTVFAKRIEVRADEPQAVSA